MVPLSWLHLEGPICQCRTNQGVLGVVFDQLASSSLKGLDAHLNLQDILVSFNGNGGLLERCKVGVVHVQEFKLAGRVSVEHEGHLGDDWRADVELLQRRRSALDIDTVLPLVAHLP